MLDWIEDDPTLVVVVLAGVAGALALVALVLLILWRRASSKLARAVKARIEAEHDRLDHELLIAEQGSRFTIVRELHELLVNSVSVVVSQADGARYAASTDPGIAARTAATIADTARTTLADLRRVMDIVREGETQAGPQPSLSSVRELFKILRDSGLEVDFVETGERLGLKQGAELAVYRILQEALGNALRHGGEGTSARVGFTWTDRGLEVLVEDDGVRARARREGADPDELARQRPYSQEDDLAALTRRHVGRGMTEMRERTEMFGGVFSATEVPGVGFSISAIFPGIRHHNGVHAVGMEQG